MTAANVNTLRAFIERVWNEGELEAIPDYLAPHYVIRHDPGDPWHGQTLDVAGFAERVRRSRAPFPDQRFEFVELIAEGERVVMTWRWRATHRGDIDGFAATGKPVAMTGATVYSFEDGKISGHWQIADRLSVFQQLAANRDSPA